MQSPQRKKKIYSPQRQIKTETDTPIFQDQREKSFKFQPKKVKYCMPNIETISQQKNFYQLQEEFQKFSKHLRDGQCCLGLRKFEKAIEFCESALGISRNSTPALECKADALIALNRCNEALKILDEIIEKDKFNEKNYFKKGQMHSIQMNKYYQSLELFDVCIRADRQNYKYYFQKGLALHQIGLFAEAREQYDAVFSFRKNHYFAICKKGQELKNYQEALIYFDKALKIIPNDELNYFYKGSNYNNKKPQYIQLNKNLSSQSCSFNQFVPKSCKICKEDFFAKAFIEQFIVNICQVGLALAVRNLKEESLDTFEIAFEFDPESFFTYYAEGMLIVV